MPGIVEFPTLVQDALDQFGDLFPNEAQRRHFGEYLTGLFVAERQSVLGIPEEFAQTTDRSCLNRFLTHVDWDVEALNRRRLELLQEDPVSLDAAWTYQDSSSQGKAAHIREADSD